MGQDDPKPQNSPDTASTDASTGDSQPATAPGGDKINGPNDQYPGRDGPKTKSKE